jgi:hypothetical protein
MLDSFPSAWLLLALPFLSAAVIAAAGPLSRVASIHHRVTWPLGLVGLVGLVAGLTGLLSPALSLPVAIAGGAVSGFAMFWVRRDGDDDDNWRWRDRPPDDPPPDPVDHAPLDWELFDRLRAEWASPRLGRR